jgi:YggT family protein
MFIMGNLVEATATILNMGLTIYMWIIIIRVLISWVNPDPYNPIVQLLIRATEPVLARVRRVVPVLGAGIDLSPLIVIFAIYFLQAFLVGSLHDLAFRFR